MRDETLSVVVYEAKRLGNTANGNPNWHLFTDRGDFKTKPNASCSYQVSRGWTDKPVALTFNSQGQVIGIDERAA